MPKIQAKPQQPTWARDLSDKYRAGISYTFLLHGDVQDYVGGVPGQTLKNYLLASFAARNIVVYWNMESGFYLPTKEMRRQFVEIVGLQLPATQSGRTGGLAAGLNTLQQVGDITSLLAQVRSPAAALELLSRLLRYKPDKKQGMISEEEEPWRVAVVMDYAEFLAPESSGVPGENDRLSLVTLSEWSRDPVIAGNDAIVVLIATDLGDVNSRLKRSAARWEQVEIPYPDFSERVAFIQRLVAQQSEEVAMAEDFSYEDFARLTTGLRFIDIEDIVLRASFLQAPISRTLVKQRKDEIMRGEYADLLQVEENEFGFEVIGGMDEIKAYVSQTIITPMLEGPLRIVPKGVLFLGPPGTGKTLFARALSKEAGLTFVFLQLSQIYMKWVGDTERRLARALYAIKSMTPCLVFVDEVDQAFQRGESGDSGVSNRVFKMVLEFMSDPLLRGKVLFIGATNKPNLMDAALLRPGRYDEKIPFFIAPTEERADILHKLTELAFPGMPLPEPSEFLRLAERMEEYPGAEMEHVVTKALSLYERREHQISLEEALQQAFELILPSTPDIDELTKLALLYVSDLELVPERYRDLARQMRHPDARKKLLTEIEETQQPYSRRKREL